MSAASRYPYPDDELTVDCLLFWYAIARLRSVSQDDWRAEAARSRTVHKGQKDTSS